MAKLRLSVCLLILVCPAALLRAEPTTREVADARLPGKVKDAEMLAAKLDRLLAARWVEAGVQPAAAADDAEFLRRVYLDLAGTIPSVSEVRDFLDDRSPDKRRRVIDRLLEGPEYAAHFTNVWRAAWLPDNVNVDNFGLRFPFESWLRVRLKENMGYDRMVREILTATPPAGGRGDFQNGLMAANNGLSPVSFALANENKPENLAGSSSRLFLAVRLECAQCHNHPHARWTREQFWQYAAFFAGGTQGNRREIAIPGLGKSVSARFPDGTEPAFKQGASGRITLAYWATSADNKFFARAGANRVWAHFFGSGLIEPVDDMLRDGEQSEVLDELARQFAAQNFDLKFLIRTIVNTRAYQLTSISNHESQDDPLLFARMAVKGLTTEQVVASLMEATGYQAPAGQAPGLSGTGLLRADLGGSFARQLGKSTEFQTSIPQALALMNGRFVKDATSLERSGTLAAVANAPFMNTAERIETLYLAALGRKPTAEESRRLVRHVTEGAASGDSNKVLADVFWALLNSSEFIFNH